MSFLVTYSVIIHNIRNHSEQSSSLGTQHLNTFPNLRTFPIVGFWNETRHMPGGGVYGSIGQNRKLKYLYSLIISSKQYRNETLLILNRDMSPGTVLGSHISDKSVPWEKAAVMLSSIFLPLQRISVCYHLFTCA